MLEPKPLISPAFRPLVRLLWVDDDLLLSLYRLITLVVFPGTSRSESRQRGNTPRRV